MISSSETTNVSSRSTLASLLTPTVIDWTSAALPVKTSHRRCQHSRHPPASLSRRLWCTNPEAALYRIGNRDVKLERGGPGAGAFWQCDTGKRNGRLIVVQDGDTVSGDVSTSISAAALGLICDRPPSATANVSSGSSTLSAHHCDRHGVAFPIRPDEIDEAIVVDIVPRSSLGRSIVHEVCQPEAALDVPGECHLERDRTVGPSRALADLGGCCGQGQRGRVIALIGQRKLGGSQAAVMPSVLLAVATSA